MKVISRKNFKVEGERYYSFGVYTGSYQVHMFTDENNEVWIPLNDVIGQSISFSYNGNKTEEYRDAYDFFEKKLTDDECMLVIDFSHITKDYYLYEIMYEHCDVLVSARGLRRFMLDGTFDSHKDYNLMTSFYLWMNKIMHEEKLSYCTNIRK